MAGIDLLGGFAGRTVFLSARKVVGDDAGTEAAAEELADTMRDLLETPGTGHKHRGWRTPNRSSSPGDPPAKQLENLIGSIDHWQEGKSWRVGVSKVSEAADYVIPLEYGTAMMAPRPFMRPAAQMSESRMLRAAAKQLAEDLVTLQLGRAVGGVFRKIRIGGPGDG
jgi:HK97 gp10 family phage protein